MADVDPLGRGHADKQARVAQQVRGQPDRARLPVGTGHGHDRHPGRHAERVQLADDVVGHVTLLALARLQVHAQPGRGVDLDDAARLAQGARRLGDVAHAQVDAADVESDGRRGARAHPGHRRVNVVGHVLACPAGGQVGIVAQLDYLALLGHRGRRQALLAQVAEYRVIQDDLGEGPVVADAAPGVRVGPLYQAGDVEDTVAGHLGGRQLRRDDLVAYHQDAVVGARDVVLDKRRPAHFADRGERAARFLRRLDDENVSPVVTEHRLHDDPGTEPVVGRGCLRRVMHHGALGHGDARGGQHLLSDRLIAGDVHADDRGLVRARRPDQPPVGAVAELQQPDVRRPADRDAAVPGGTGKRGGRYPQPVLVIGRGEALQLRAGHRQAAALGDAEGRRRGYGPRPAR